MTTKELRTPRRARDRAGQLSPDAENLVAAALGLAHSGSRSEDRFWEHQLGRLVDRSLDSTHSSALMTALERLNQTDGEAYAALIESVEHAAETVEIGAPSTPAAGARAAASEPCFGLLLTAPLVVWTRFAIPSGAIPQQAAAELGALWKDLILAPGVSFRMIPWLYSLDQLPREFPELRRLTRRLTTAASTDSEPRIDVKSMPESADMLADPRFLVAAVSVPDSLQPLFRWQVAGGGGQTRVQCLEQWVANARPVIEPLLPGCGFECLLPDAYHINLRESDRRVRPYGIKAAVHSLTHAMAIEPAGIRATVGAFGDDRIDEYRIGLSVGDDEDVLRGVVWPLLGSETESDEPSPLERIREALREAGVENVEVWQEVNQPEFCEDCGAPLYPGPNDEVVHVEMPDEPTSGPNHFH